MTTPPRMIMPYEKVCYNCDNFMRDDEDFLGQCLFRTKRVSNDKQACKKYEQRLEPEREY